MECGVQQKLIKIIQDILPNKDPGDHNLFNSYIGCGSLEAVYILLQIKDTFNIHIDKTFVESIRDMTVSNLTKAILHASDRR